METYYTKVSVQADRSEVKCAEVTIVVENKEMTEEEFIAEYGVRSNHEPLRG